MAGRRPAHLVCEKSRFGVASVVTDIEADVERDGDSWRAAGIGAGEVLDSYVIKRNELPAADNCMSC